MAEYVDPNWDARTLADAERIKADPSRLAKAKAAAAMIHSEDSARLNAMASVAGVKSSDKKDDPVTLKTHAGPMKLSRVVTKKR